MKNLLLLLPLVFLISCSSPQKYLEIGEYELAFFGFQKKAKHSKSPKVIDGLVASYTALNKIDQELLNEWEKRLQLSTSEIWKLPYGRE